MLLLRFTKEKRKPQSSLFHFRSDLMKEELLETSYDALSVIISTWVNVRYHVSVFKEGLE